MSALEQKNVSTVLEPNYFSNWGDLWFPHIANLLLYPVSRLGWATPNAVTITSFLLYLLAAACIATGGDLAFWAAPLLPLSYILDCLDGQLARYTGKSSAIGDYLDKTLDVLKIGLINMAFAYAAYQLTNQVLYVFLGFLSCFGFLFRYYIKLETMFGAINRDPLYLEKSRLRRHELYASLECQRSAPKSLAKQLSWIWFRHHSLFALDEAEHVILGVIAVCIQRPDLWLWLFGMGQITIALIRLVQRGEQIASNSESLTYPMRK